MRELDLAGLPDEQRNWINDHTVYTHGFGFVAAWATSRPTAAGRRSSSSDIPPKGELGEFEPRIYFGEESPTYSHRRRPEGATPVELDFPDDAAATGSRNTTYQGKGGVPVGIAVQQAAVRDEVPGAEHPALRPGQRRLAGSSTTATPKERVEKVAPWLTLDGDPYPAVVDGRIQWIVDGYTTTQRLPVLHAHHARDVDGRLADHRRPAAVVTPGRTGSTTSATRSRRPSTPTTARSRSTRGTTRTRCSRPG